MNGSPRLSMLKILIKDSSLQNSVLNRMRNNSVQEENILPPLDRVKLQDETVKKTSRTGTNSALKFKALENTVWNHNGKDFIKRDEVTELDRRLNTQMNSQKNNSSDYLISLKKAYDEMVKNTVRREGQTYKLKQEIDQIKRNLELGSKDSNIERKEFQDLQKNYTTIKGKQDASSMAGKTLEHILARMKKDEITYQIKINCLQKSVRELDASIDVSEMRQNQLSSFRALSTITAKQVKESYMECNDKRRRDMETYQNLMRKKQDADKKEQERHKVTTQIQTIAASDLNDANLIKWKKLLMVQLVVKKILKFKINNLESKYGQIKTAFHTIKLKTSINQPCQLAGGYFKLEDTYLNLLENVKTLEQSERTLQKQKVQLQSKYEALGNEYYDINRDSETEDHSQSQAYKLGKETAQKSFAIGLIKEKMYSWVVGNLWKLAPPKQNPSVDKKKFYQLHKKENLEQYIVQFCDSVEEHALELERLTASQPQVMFEELKSLEMVTNCMSQNEEEEQEEEGGQVEDANGSKKRKYRG